MKCLFAFDSSGSVRGNVGYHKLLEKIINQYGKPSDLFDLWDDVSRKLSYEEMKKFIKDKGGYGDNASELIADPINYYDFIIDINSFRHLQKSNEIKDWGWVVLTNKNFNYKEAIEKDYVSIGVVGNGNRGKSFLLSKISNFNFPTGYSVKNSRFKHKISNFNFPTRYNVKNCRFKHKISYYKRWWR